MENCRRRGVCSSLPLGYYYQRDCDGDVLFHLSTFNYSNLYCIHGDVMIICVDKHNFEGMVIKIERVWSINGLKIKGVVVVGPCV